MKNEFKLEDVQGQLVGVITPNPQVQLRQWALEQTKETYTALNVSAWIKAAEELVTYVRDGKQP